MPRPRRTERFSLAMSGASLAACRQQQMAVRAALGNKLTRAVFIREASLGLARSGKIVRVWELATERGVGQDVVVADVLRGAFGGGSPPTPEPISKATFMISTTPDEHQLLADETDRLRDTLEIRDRRAPMMRAASVGLATSGAAVKVWEAAKERKVDASEVIAEALRSEL